MPRQEIEAHQRTPPAVCGTAEYTVVRQVPNVECEALPGLEEFLDAELRRRFEVRRRRFEWRRPLADLLSLRTANAAYLVGAFAGRRPTALLGDQNLRTLAALVADARRLHPPGAFHSLRISAAGRESSPFLRLAAAIQEATGLPHDPEDGDLLVRVRPRADGWEALVRLTPRPLATRPWRVNNWPGALNATVAAAMVELTEPRPGQRFASLLCGSGTLLVERHLRAPATEVVGFDVDPQALAAALANLAAAGLAGRTRLELADARALGAGAGPFHALAADLPYGNLVGTHRDNATLYPAVLREAAGVATPGSPFAVITHEVRLLETALRSTADDWRVERAFRVLQGGVRPQVTLLRRR
jgi:tRNA (guanine6-N2)-methyltransferase